MERITVDSVSTSIPSGFLAYLTISQPAKVPEKILESTRTTLWFKKDDQFWAPTARVKLNIRMYVSWPSRRTLSVDDFSGHTPAKRLSTQCSPRTRSPFSYWYRSEFARAAYIHISSRMPWPRSPMMLPSLGCPTPSALQRQVFTSPSEDIMTGSRSYFVPFLRN